MPGERPDRGDPGDGVGQEVVPEGVRALSAVDPALEFIELDWRSARWERTGAMMPADGIAQLREYDAVYWARSAGRRSPTTSRCGAA